VAGSELSFEQIRDGFFVNPKIRSAGVLPAAAEFLTNRLLNNYQKGFEAETETTGVMTDFIGTLGEEMSQARRFDHLSLAQLHPADNIAATLGHFASTLLNNNTIIGEVSPVECNYERQSIDWIAEKIVGYKDNSFSGSIVTGGTSANLTAMLVARDKAIKNNQWDGKSQAVILTNEMAHYSIKKSANILAPGQLIQVDQIPLAGNSFVADIDKLSELIKVHLARRNTLLAIVGTAGETETGLVEDLEAMANLAEQFGIYFHIDGAYGAPFKLSRAGHRFDSLKQADSVTCDPHKYLYTPYPAGTILFKDRSDHDLIAKLNDDARDYMFKVGDEQRAVHQFKPAATTFYGRYRIEGSMGGQGAAAVYSTIRTLGEAGLAKLLDHTLDLTEHFVELINESGSLRPVYEPHLNSVCVIPNSSADCYPKELEAKLEETCAEMERDEGIYIATTALPLRNDAGKREQRKVLRIVPTHPHTDKNDLDFVAETLISKWNNKL
jgi:glutamate/tyrosine decarboxylase-like PLP-dependent enzyme